MFKLFGLLGLYAVSLGVKLKVLVEPHERERERERESIPCVSACMQVQARASHSLSCLHKHIRFAKILNFFLKLAYLLVFRLERARERASHVYLHACEQEHPIFSILPA
jgi:hypothetical protein